MSMAIKYAMMKKHKKMAEGGEVEMMEDKPNPVDISMKKAFKTPKKYAEGGFIHEEEESGYEPMPEEHASHEYKHPVENQEDHEDMVGRIILKHLSKGGMVANATPIKADFEENEFDDLVKDDGLEQHYTGANSGDELGDEQEDHDRHDMISMIMKSRKKKDRLPHPM